MQNKTINQQFLSLADWDSILNVGLNAKKSESSKIEQPWTNLVKDNKSSSDGSNGAPAVVAKFQPAVIDGIAIIYPWQTTINLNTVRA